MKTIILSFIKRAVVIPLVITALCFSLIYFGIAGFTSRSDNQEKAPVQTVSFEEFSALSAGDCIGRLSAGEYENSVMFADGYDDALFLGEYSGEPWNGGSVFIFGNSSNKQLGALRGLSKGDEVTLELFSNSTFTYKIRGVRYGLSINEVNKLSGKNKLYLCRSYYDFAGDGKSKLYAVYTADKTKA